MFFARVFFLLCIRRRRCHLFIGKHFSCNPWQWFIYLAWWWKIDDCRCWRTVIQHPMMTPPIHRRTTVTSAWHRPIELKMIRFDEIKSIVDFFNVFMLKHRINDGDLSLLIGNHHSKGRFFLRNKLANYDFVCFLLVRVICIWLQAFHANLKLKLRCRLFWLPLKWVLFGELLEIVQEFYLKNDSKVIVKQSGSQPSSWLKNANEQTK